MSTELALRTLEDYEQAGGFNVIAPVVTIEGGVAISPYLAESVSVVKISAHPAAADIYHDFRYANERDGKAALTSLALTKFAAAAGVKWVPDLCKVLHRERRDDGTVYIAYQAGAAIRALNGEMHVEIASKELDTADIAEQLTDAYGRKLEAGRARYNASDIPDMVRRELLQIREHALSLVETKAKSRCIRRILALKQTYTKEELSRPFAVPRLVYRPDATDPMQLERIQLEGERAAQDLYGGRELPAAAGAPASVTPPEDGQAPGPEEGASVANGERKKEPSAPPSDVDANGSGADLTPSGDPKFYGGPHKGERFSEVCDTDFDYVKAIANGEVEAKAHITKLAQEWVTFTEASKP